VTLREVLGKYLYCKHWLRIFEFRPLRKTFELTRDEVQGEGRKLHNEEAYDMYC
jgi:hypothetical protein